MKSLCFWKPLKVESVVEQVNNLISTAENSVVFVDAILKVAEEKRGKILNANFAKAVEKRVKEIYPCYDVRYSRPCSNQIYLSFWHKGEPYRSLRNTEIFIGYTEDRTIEPDTIKECARAHWLDRERLPKYREALSRIPDWVARYNRGLNLIQQAQKEAELFELNYYLAEKENY